MKMLSALRFFATGSYQRPIGQDFLSCLLQTTVSRCVGEVTTILITVQATYERFPNEAEEPGIKAEFYQKYGFPGIIGLMDLSHIKIIAPKGDLESLYYCRKGGHSINLLLISIQNTKFFMPIRSSQVRRMMHISGGLRQFKII
ncbi:putative nuclease HARBI1 [Rhagoletis pomonella]|uniref:putative nuclease HARBI1 n=1 Tax=Rhagoletis pomonella TaxID=28610 RepID=UPI001786BF3C|nr:putative nuclease HARBI1 [Rhagoletis pomonella]